MSDNSCPLSFLIYFEFQTQGNLNDLEELEWATLFHLLSVRFHPSPDTWS